MEKTVAQEENEREEVIVVESTIEWFLQTRRERDKNLCFWVFFVSFLSWVFVFLTRATP
ncbi:hypothetical protein ASPWEDRAFT_43688 [Aspergillus wentii DTO 134E9]|uniref:Transmembrane protein n=1 Tax=Aspergillus wentii DTO 134E9 TaxID=1073089 RepID=A0A1L9R762_ASPWE|nr:uncharacterized protein ASPWEDRAFT_44733 [Aspergillus wentii DTO 134E9]XP_040685409.1 uncharacterized protein ASPWEDRAFT_43688 [Aspergillus wentii DTO 134E9]OJJ30749.1 hypothetical protein ASPWEDRAFT_44733 [Aspergillus wentii DTO 134E9]OJJ31732.1 hypothetical protein ASPWEDRAFT_43688 [Aspergillus wentii DTO 134E9]